jgi:hypothetical protein
MVDRIAVRVSLGGDLSEDQLDRLVQIAERCPIHRMLVPQVQIQTTRNDTSKHCSRNPKGNDIRANSELP